MVESNSVKPLELLVIDDEQPVRDVVSRMFQRFGANVTTAKDGVDGLSKYMDRLNSGIRYDAIITDLNMPREDNVRADGSLVTRIVKQTSPATPVIVITGYEATEDYVRLSKELGELKPDGIIKKPFSISDIKTALDYINNLIQNRRTNPGYQAEPLIISKQDPSQS